MLLKKKQHIYNLTKSRDQARAVHYFKLFKFHGEKKSMDLNNKQVTIF